MFMKGDALLRAGGEETKQLLQQYFAAVGSKYQDSIENVIADAKAKAQTSGDSWCAESHTLPWLGPGPGRWPGPWPHPSCCGVPPAAYSGISIPALCAS